MPENFRETIARWGLWSYRVMLFEREGDGRFKPPEAYPAAALATFNTHDLPTFRGWLEGHDMRVKRAIGFDPGEERRRARLGHGRSCATCWPNACPTMRPTISPRWRNFWALTPSHLVAISLDDVLGERDQVNIPGTTDQHPNWQRKLPLPIEAARRPRHLAPRGRGVRQGRAEY